MEPHFNGAHTQTLDSFCVYFSFVFCPIWKAFTITISFPASSLPHHFALLGFAFTTRPSNYVVYLLTHKFLPFLYYYFFFCSDKDVFVCHSLSSLLCRLATGCSRCAVIRRPFNHEWDYFIIYFLSAALRIFRFFAFKKVNKVWRRALWVLVAFFMMRYFWSIFFFFSSLSLRRVESK